MVNWNNQEEVREYKKEWRKNHLEKEREYKKEWRKNHPEKSSEYSKNWREKEENKDYQKGWSEKNPEKREAIRKRCYQKHADKRREYKKEYYRKNRELEIQKAVIRNKEKKDSDPNYAIAQRLRYRVKAALRNYVISGIVLYSELIDYKAIIEHLKPIPENLSLYHIDHIKPLCSFKFVEKDGSLNLEEIKKAFSPENHQWLLAEENRRKVREDLKSSIKLNESQKYE
ncbi:hypothetical protein CCP1ISM_60047 [Azospirillaceae bacterium]